MNGVRQITGRAVAVIRPDVDTDQIIPAAWLKRVERTGFGAGLFEAWRKDPEFALNKPGASEAKILLSGPNFGCGSSREHAVWALQDYGFQAVVAPSFADIFRGNAISAGLVPAQVSEDALARLAAALTPQTQGQGTEAVLDVAARTISIADVTEPFELADYAQWRLIEGLDDVGLTLRHEDAIAAYESRRPEYLPSVAGSASTAL